ncbi:MAG: alpha/beta hydrolase family protein [Actinomycetes bacterium]
MRIFPLPSRPAALAGLAVLTAVPLLAGCAGESEALSRLQREQATRENVPLNGCDEVECEGELDGADYEIRLPDEWNGTLMIYSHGYRQAEPAPPDFEPVDTAPATAPNDEVADELLADGYALAGSAFRSNGWDVLDGVAAGEALHEFFTDEIGEPDRVYVWGDSLGGLITQTLAEKHPAWVSGVAPFCGVLGGSNLNLDLALDAAYAIKTLIYPELKLTGFASHDEAVANWEAARDAIAEAGADIESGVPALLVVAAMTDVPAQTRTYDGSGIESQVRARAESILTAIGYGTFGRYEIEQRVGGNPSGNEDADYAGRLSDDERSLIDTVSQGAADELVQALEDGERVAPETEARAEFDTMGNPTGKLADKTITMHTTADPLVIVQNERVFRDRVSAARGRTGDLVQLYTLPPATYDEETGAPFGAGHCNFTAPQRLAVIELLDGWVREGRVPGSASIPAAFTGDPFVSQSFAPGAWPAEEGAAAQ